MNGTPICAVSRKNPKSLMQDKKMNEIKDFPPGDYGIVDLFGHTTLAARIAEIKPFGTKMLAIEPMFNGEMLPVVFHGGAAIYRLTPCSYEIAAARQPTQG